jgi:hypothetical protein
MPPTGTPLVRVQPRGAAHGHVVRHDVHTFTTPPYANPDRAPVYLRCRQRSCVGAADAPGASWRAADAAVMNAAGAAGTAAANLGGSSSRSAIRRAAIQRLAAVIQAGIPDTSNRHRILFFVAGRRPEPSAAVGAGGGGSEERSSGSSPAPA